MARVQAADADQYIQCGPDLAIGIVSPSESMIESQLIWVLMPKHRRIRIFRADGTSTVRHPGELLDAPELFPSSSIAVAQVFDFS